MRAKLLLLTPRWTHGVTAGFDGTQCERSATLRGFNNYWYKKRGSKTVTTDEKRNVGKEVWPDFITS